MIPDTYDVAIVGYGPTGELLANLLGAEGFRVAVFERAPSVYHMPRAAHFDHEIMRILQNVGLAEAVEPATAWLPGMLFIDAQGDRLFGFEQPPGPTAMGWDADYVFYQPQLETFLRQGAERYPSVEVFLEHDVDEVVDRGEHAELVVRDLRSGASRRVAASYVVGCDGARSVTRRCAGIEKDDLGFDESWLVVDVRLTEPVDLPALCHQVCDPARPTTFVPLPEPYRRWEFMLLPGESPADLEHPDRVLELLHPWVQAEQVEIIRSVVYTFHAVLAKGWRSGRVLIAGDAAHLMPPFLGQGMCSGFRDAANLGWKLPLVLRGTAPDTLLDTYESERSPHVRSIIDLAVSFGGIICTIDPAVAAQRDAGFRANPQAFSQDQTTLTPPLGPGVVDPAPATGGAGAVGKLFIQPWIGDPAGVRARFDDVAGPGFVLLSTDGDPAAALAPGAAAAWKQLGGVALTLDDELDPSTGEVLRITDADGHLRSWFDRHGAQVVLLRPDHYVFGASGTVDDADVLVTRLATALGLQS